MVFRELSDNGTYFPYKDGCAKDITTALISLGGITVGAIGNNISEDAGSGLSFMGMKKAAQFAGFCDSFSIPLLMFVSIDGFEKSIDTEKYLKWQIADFTKIIAGSNVPKAAVYAKHLVGTAPVFFGAKSLGVDIAFAYPDTNMELMNAKDLARITNGDVPMVPLKEDALSKGYIDRVIGYADTRKYLISAFDMLYTKA